MKRTPIKPKTEKPCPCGCGNIVKIYNSVRDTHFSPACKIRDKGYPKKSPLSNPIARKPINKVSEKRKHQNSEYFAKRKEYLARTENQKCFIDGCNRIANTVEHRCGRSGVNYLYESTWAPCCLQHNLELENNPELSKKYQLSRIHGGKRE